MNDDDVLEEEILAEEQQIVAERASSEEDRLAAAGLTHSIGQLPILRPPVTCARNKTVREAIEIMQAEQTGFILVVENERLIGMFTERDLLNKVAGRDIDIDAVAIDDIMTPDPESLGGDYELVYAINQMSVGGYRHIPIVDAEGRPLNVVSARNIVDYLASLYPKTVLNLPPDPEHAIPPAPDGG